MKLNTILEKYSDVLLDQISSDKVQEALTLRLPRSVITQEIISALSSLSYISDKLTNSKPPTYAFLKIILSEENYSVPIDGFREKVLGKIKELSIKSLSLSEQSNHKYYNLYKNILKSSWSSNDDIDESESSILEALRGELNIWKHEHYIIEHHPEILKLWDLNNNYVVSRNFLLSTGLILTYENNYVIAEEVAIQIERALGIELNDITLKRMLSNFKKEELSKILEINGLAISGSKEEIIERILSAVIPPSELLNVFQLETLREYCKGNSIQSSGVKGHVINNIIQHFDQNLDLVKEADEILPILIPETPEIRILDKTNFSKILSYLTNNQLYDALFQCSLQRSGTKDEKIFRLVESNWSEKSILNKLRKEDLSTICRKLGLNVSGVKSELTDRILFEPFIFKSKPSEEIQSINSENILEKETFKVEVENENESEIQKEIVENITSPLPLCFEEINSKYSDLQYDEKVILSLIKDIKSMTEQDIERSVLRHKLRWFLHKAHMMDLISKLELSNENPIKIKSAGSVNIYEWVGNAPQKEEAIEKRSARDIIDALRQGVVPNNNLNLLVVGQSNARKHLCDLLEEANLGKSPFKFIRGPYGSGKTFVCSWLKEYALQNEFAVSTINIGPDQPLSDLPVFFSGLINGLRTPEKKESSALEDILESWLLNIHKKTAQIEGLNIFDKITRDKLDKLIEIVEKRVESELSNISDIDPGFAPALRAFYFAKYKGDQKSASAAVAWLTGSRSLSGQSLRDIGVKGYLEANNVFSRIRALLEVINGAKYRGLVLLVDELELVRKFPHTRQREQALETLRLLIDESGKNGLPGCLVLLTGTDEFFEDERYGLKSYPALAERVLISPVNENFISMRQPIITLEGLDKERLLSVISKIRDLHGIAYEWSSSEVVKDDAVNNLIDDWTTFGDSNISRKPRPVLREFIHILDLCEENPGVNVNEFIKMNSNTDVTSMIPSIFSNT
ncbi:MAG TPA: DUF2791 family P-loop domain-containing protein [Ignavibacteria bacterium]|nr:DUF2791 family P-loop domain-containing protein [Ignavibacteria bacterium]HMR41839.1 DUF2791 family P-loop domain-containing protein [Ignavibacteria bacterium]